MSRLTGNEIASLMEAYSAVYAPQELTEEQIWEEVENWVNSLVEEGYDLSEYTWEEMYENYIEEVWGTQPSSYKPNANALDKAMSSLPSKVGKAMGFGSSPDRKGQVYAGPGVGWVKRQSSSTQSPTPASGDYKSRFAGARDAAFEKAKNIKGSPVVGPGLKGGVTAAPAKPGPSGSGVAPTRPATAKVAPTKPSGSASDQWAKANPKLAAAEAEKARIRGTQQTDNPLMKDMKSRLPMNSPSVQSPAVSKLGAGNQSLSQNPNAFKAATPTKAIAAAPSTSAAASGSVAPVTAKLAATPKPTPVAPRQTARERVLSQSYEYDAFDLVLEYLLDNGHVETVDEALYVMMEMDTEVIQDIVEGSYEDRIAANNKKYDRNRQRAAQRAAARNAARDAGKTGSVPGVGYVTPRRERETYTDAAGTERHKTGAKMPKKD